MPEFRDTENRRWSLRITIADAKRVRDACGVNLLQILDDPTILTQIAGDPITFVDLLYVLCQPQAEAQGVSDVQFGESLDGEAIEAATDAFLAALVSFFPPVRRTTLQKILDRAGKHAEEKTAALRKMTDDGTLDAALDKALATDGPTSTASPAPQESNQAA